MLNISDMMALCKTNADVLYSPQSQIIVFRNNVQDNFAGVFDNGVLQCTGQASPDDHVALYTLLLVLKDKMREETTRRLRKRRELKKSDISMADVGDA